MNPDGSTAASPIRPPALASQRLTVPVSVADATTAPFGDHATELTGALIPEVIRYEDRGRTI